MRPRLTALLGLLTLLPAICAAQTTKPSQQPAAEYLAWLPPSARAVTCMTMDAQGNTWIGTEDDGVYLHKTGADSGRHFTTDDGIGDNDIFAIRCDRVGRVWVGHARHGVSVFWNGRWKNYDVPDGPIGDRVWAIAECPLDGDIWIATNAGLTRYSAAKDSWRHYTPGQAPYADSICAMAFDGKGRLFAATECQGLVRCEPSGGEYRSWTHIPGPKETPQADRGKGLPSGLLNDVLVAADQSVWAATDGGLAWSRDAGATWEFLRGEDWVLKPRGASNRGDVVTYPFFEDWFRNHASRNGPATPAEEGPTARLLAEDNITSLAEDRHGNIWMGFREQGLGFIDPRTLKVTRLNTKSLALKNGIVFCVLPQQDDSLLIGNYGGGAARVRQSITARMPALPAAAPPPVAKPRSNGFPATAPPPTLPELNALCNELGSVPVLEKENRAVLVQLPDDWRTQGNWLGRYGRYWACICAIDSPSDYLWGAGPDPVSYWAGIGSNHYPGDSQRYWVNRLYTSDSRVLEIPPIYMDSRIQQKLTTPDRNRREACWVDNGQAYDRYHEGPNLVGNLGIPAGSFILSFYFQEGSADRDYVFSLRVFAGGMELSSVEETEKLPALTETRVHDFYHGVYKRFLVQGPVRIGYKIDKNYSGNTILAGIMLDLTEECPPPYFQTVAKWERVCRDRDASLARMVAARHGRPEALGYARARDAAFAALGQLRDLQDLNPKWWAAHSRAHYVSLLRWLNTCRLDREIIAGRAQCCHTLALFDPWEEYQGQLGLTTARWIEHQLKWDGKTSSFSGAGRQIVSKFVEEHIKK